MSGKSSLEGLEKKGNNAEKIAEAIIKDESLLGSVLEGVSSKNARARYKCARTLKIVSEMNPQVLYPYLEFFDKLLSSKNSIIKRNAMDILANLAAVDEEDYVRKLW